MSHGPDSSNRLYTFIFSLSVKELTDLMFVCAFVWIVSIYIEPLYWTERTSSHTSVDCLNLKVFTRDFSHWIPELIRYRVFKVQLVCPINNARNKESCMGNVYLHIEIYNICIIYTRIYKRSILQFLVLDFVLINVFYQIQQPWGVSHFQL